MLFNSLRKSRKVDQCHNFQKEIGAELYVKLLGLRGKLQLKLDHHRFEGQCFEVNKVLIEHGYFLRVFELKKKFSTVKKKDSKKQEAKKNVSSCIMEKFKGFDIVSISSSNFFFFCKKISQAQKAQNRLQQTKIKNVSKKHLSSKINEVIKFFNQFRLDNLVF